jgi:hypothetical protein
MEVSKREHIAIISGFHSKMERNVLEILLKGQCGIIIVLARGMYRKLPKQYEEAMSQNRLLIISNEKDNVKRVSEQTAHKRNEFVREIADEMMQLKIQ